MLTMERWMAMTFGEVVRFHRERLGLTQVALSHRLRLPDYRVTKAETGAALRRIPEPKTFRLWADALETPPEVILEQMGYLDPKEKAKQPEMLFTSLAEEIRSADNVPAEVRTTALEGINQARRMYEVVRKRDN